MKKISFFKVAALACSLGVMMVSCSDKDDVEPVVPESTQVEKVFPLGLPESVGDAKISVNENGQVTEIKDGDETISFAYGKFSRATDYDVMMTIVDTLYPDDRMVFYMQTNEDGFVTYAVETESGEEDTIWNIEYNSDNQMTKVRKSKEYPSGFSSESVFKITYENGDIIGVVASYDGEDYSGVVVKYTNNSFVNSVENKGGIMIFEDTFHLDIDNIVPAYYAGLLGKSTKHLPMIREYYHCEDPDDKSPETFMWEFNDKDLPVKFYSIDDPYNVKEFKWR